MNFDPLIMCGELIRVQIGKGTDSRILGSHSAGERCICVSGVPLDLFLSRDRSPPASVPRQDRNRLATSPIRCCPNAPSLSRKADVAASGQVKWPIQLAKIGIENDS